MSVSALILAAGTSSRFGAVKQVALLGGRPLVAHVVAAAQAGGCDEVVVVVGRDEGLVREALAGEDVRFVLNADAARGQASSLSAGLAALGPHTEAALILLADQPRVRATSVAACVDAWRDGARVARAAYDDRDGHPVIFDRSVWPVLSQLSGDIGARRILAELDVVAVPVPGLCPPDVDRPDDLPRLEGDTTTRR